MQPTKATPMKIAWLGGWAWLEGRVEGSEDLFRLVAETDAFGL
jgi:hypothetical protein